MNHALKKSMAHITASEGEWQDLPRSINLQLRDCVDFILSLLIIFNSVSILRVQLQHKDVIMKNFLISIFIVGSLGLLAGCCGDGLSCGSDTMYMTTSTPCNTCVNTCQTCGNSCGTCGSSVGYTSYTYGGWY